MLRALGEKLRKRAFARAQIADHHRRHQLQQGFGETFPRPARNIVPAELSRQFVEVAAHLVAPLFEHQLQRFDISGRFGNLAAGGMEKIQQIHKLPVFQPVEAVLALLAVFHQARLLQLRQVRRNAALPRRQDFLKLRHGKLLAFQQEQQTQAVRIRQHPKRF